MAGIRRGSRCRPACIRAGMMAKDATLLDGTSGAITPLWSLTWEVLFSLALPIFIYVAARLRPVYVVSASLAMSMAGTALGEQALAMLPIFALGVAIASRGDDFLASLERLGARAYGPLAWTAATIGASLLLVSRWWIPGASTNRWTAASVHGLVLVGALGLVVCALGCAWLRRLPLRPASSPGSARSPSASISFTSPVIKAAGSPSRGQRVAVVSCRCRLLRRRRRLPRRRREADAPAGASYRGKPSPGCRGAVAARGARPSH